jgi:transcriptional regulator with XRE-family HTH domain
MIFVPQKDTGDPELPSNPAFGARVRDARKARGWSQWDLARAVTPRVSQATISSIERGDGSSTAVLAICRLLNLAPPTAGLTVEMERWIDVGRVLARFPDVFEYHLRQLEALAATLAGVQRAAPDREGGPPKNPRH